MFPALHDVLADAVTAAGDFNFNAVRTRLAEEADISEKTAAAIVAEVHLAAA